MSKIKKIKIKQEDGTFSAPVDLGANAVNVDLTTGKNVEDEIKNINDILANPLITEVYKAQETPPENKEALWIDTTDKSSGASDYEGLINKPKINGVELAGEQTSRDLKLAPEENGVAVNSTEPQTKEKVWFQKGKNLFNDGRLLVLYNARYKNGTVTQIEADTGKGYWKIQAFNNQNYIKELGRADGDPIVGKVVLPFKKEGTFNQLRFVLNGSRIDTAILIDISSFKNGETYNISCNVTNVTQGSISWKEIQIEKGTIATDYEPYIPKKILTKNANGIFEEFYNEENYNFKSYEISSLPQHSAGTNTYLLQKKSGICILSVDLIWLNSIASGSWIKIGTIPLDIAPMRPIGAVGIMLDGSNGNPCGYGKILIRETGVIEFKTQTNIQRLAGVSFNITW